MSVKFVTTSNLNKISGIKHGFFAKNGGVSTGIYDSLNSGPGSNDALENVMENRSRAMQALGFEDGKNLYSLLQIHSDVALHLTSIPPERLQADAMVTNTPGIALGMLTADCTPILFADNNNGVIGAAHAGWKGAIGGIIENTIIEMEKIGANRANISAAIGPTISQSSYEVGAEFYDRFVTENKSYAGFFIPSKKENHYMFNLPAFSAHRLEKAGVGSIEDTALDTCSDRENFFSYRRTCLEKLPDYGRNISVIVIP